MPLAEPICIVGHIRICSLQNDSVKRDNRKIHLLSKLYQIALATFTCFLQVFTTLCWLVFRIFWVHSVLELGTVSSPQKTCSGNPRSRGPQRLGHVQSPSAIFHGFPWHILSDFIIVKIEIVLDHTLSYFIILYRILPPALWGIDNVIVFNHSIYSSEVLVPTGTLQKKNSFRPTAFAH